LGVFPLLIYKGKKSATLGFERREENFSAKIFLFFRSASSAVAFYRTDGEEKELFFPEIVKIGKMTADRVARKRTTRTSTAALCVK
jgi:hypothetical protein